MDLVAVLGAMIKDNIWCWEVSLGKRQSHDTSVFGELQPRTDFAKGNPLFSITVDCALREGKSRKRKQQKVVTFGYYCF